MKDMGKNVYNTGMLYFNVAGLVTNSTHATQYGLNAAGLQTACNFGSFDTLILGGVLYTAQVGINYRRLKKGKMTKSQFKRALKLGAS